ncbi:MAG: hypothetical protein N2Z58_06855 [Fervidobacterium sp.]|nr:hypothetical protein [Fervidobacterium sp.]
MERAEKMVSYVKYERELENEYREKLSDAKRKSDVRDVFSEFLIKLLKRIVPEVSLSLVEYIKFEDKEFKFEFTGELQKLIDDLGKSSDLKAIINRMYESALHRYKKIEHDENLDYFRMNNSR